MGKKEESQQFTKPKVNWLKALEKVESLYTVMHTSKGKLVNA